MQHDDRATVAVIYGLQMQNFAGGITDYFPVVNVKVPGKAAVTAGPMD